MNLLGQMQLVASTLQKEGEQILRAERHHSTSAGLRRPRKYQGPHESAGCMPENRLFGKLEDPYQHGEENIDAYLDKTSLSPWVPLPDVAARKALDIAQAGPDDRHVDLGSGDGRLCFHAHQYGVSSSIGIDIDENMVELARERLAKRHPAPPNLSFLVADLLDPMNEAWRHIQEATLITMYFATPALEKLRPLLEQKLAGRSCKIVTSGYEMPGWESVAQEVVLGTQIHLYSWGHVEGDKYGEEDFLFVGDDILKEKPPGLLQNALEGDSFHGSKIIDHTGKYPIRGFNPDIFDEEEDDDEDWDADSDDEDDNENDNEN